MNSKIQIRTLLLSVTLLLSGALYSQKDVTIDINKYYKGGENEFLMFIAKNVSYPENARENGIMGLSVFSFKIDCENSPYDFKFNTHLGYGIEEGLQKTIIKTKHKWIACNDSSANGRINMKIVFSLNGDYGYKDADFYLIADCSNRILSNNGLIKKYDKSVKKEDYNQAKEYIKLLRLRYPYYKLFIAKQKSLDLKIDSLYSIQQKNEQ